MKQSTRAVLLLFIMWFGHRDGLSQLVLPGDFPDPSVTKVGNTYWATATSSNWAPAFPLLKSNDLVQWQTAGAIFHQLPAWADFYFWAPEISYDHGKLFVYYSAHKRNGNLCLGVATADKPEGPWHDMGPIMCQEAGSIDAFPIRDESGKLFLVWKEDGNSVKKPTPIWMMEMKEDRSGLIGEKRELFRNDQPWEGNLVEGVSILRHGKYYYAFYAAASCCGAGCNYVTGIARSKKMKGPWEKYERNPVLSNDDDWICPGHGTPIEKEGRFYFLYHAYDKKSNVFTGRQGLLREFTFTPDGWIKFNELPVAGGTTTQKGIEDDFNTSTLSNLWQWSVFNTPDISLKDGALHLKGTAPRVYVAQRTYLSDYEVSVRINRKETTAQPGLALIGDDNHMIGVYADHERLVTYEYNGDKQKEFSNIEIGKADVLYLRLRVINGKDVVAFYSMNNNDFIPIDSAPRDGGFLPPWDRGVRVGLTSSGSEGQVAIFDSFSMTSFERKDIQK
jgi:xylan 1,4-beta-xylosidase